MPQGKQCVSRDLPRNHNSRRLNSLTEATSETFGTDQPVRGHGHHVVVPVDSWREEREASSFRNLHLESSSSDDVVSSLKQTCDI